MRNLTFLFICVLVLVGAFGCTSSGTRTSTPTGSAITDDAWMDLKEGVTTRDQVLKRFGEPSYTEDSGRTLRYVWQSQSYQEGGVRPDAGLLANNNQTNSFKGDLLINRATLRFDDKGVLVERDIQRQRTGGF